MIHPKFYTLYSPSPSPDCYVKRAEKTYPDEVTMNSIIRLESILDRPIPVVVKNKKKVDIMFGIKAFYLSERLFGLLSENKITGWATFPVQVTTPKNWAHKFFGLSIKGCRVPVIGEGFDFSRWDGSDFFTFERGTSVLVTERVISVFESSRITGVKWEKVIAIKDGVWI